MVSAFAARQRLVLGQVKVNEKSNEIVAISALLEMMAIEGAVITLDAMGCQRGIAKKIMDRKADYIIALKGNQGTLLEDVQVFAIEQKTRGFKDTKVSLHETTDGDHGRIERLWCTDIGVAAFYTSSH
jgi:predicted transposase YbfD/YdcC